jgi:hypothetical protein
MENSCKLNINLKKAEKKILGAEDFSCKYGKPL